MALTPLDGLETWSELDWLGLRDRLGAAGYDARILADGEAVAPGAIDALRLPLVQWRFAQRTDPAALLARLFAYDDVVSRHELAAILSASLVDQLCEARVLVEARKGDVVEDAPDRAVAVTTNPHRAVTPRLPGDPAGGVRSTFRLMPLEGLWILSDVLSGEPECVMGPGPTTLPLVRALDSARDPAPAGAGCSVLDVGCGAGTLALIAAARGASCAVGVDLNPRAVGIARLNAQLNGLACEFLQGDLFAPVAGRTFERIVAQPPYVLRPPDVAHVTFLHGGATGEEFALRLLEEIPEHLTVEGRSLVFFDFPVLSRPPIHQRIRALLGVRAVDLAVLLGAGPSPDATSVGYASLQTGDLGADYAETVVKYRAHLEQIGARSFARALVLLRRRGVGAGFSIQVPARNFRAVTAAWLERWLDSLDLGASEEASLLSAVIALPPGARWIQESATADGGDPRHRVSFGGDSPLEEQELSDGAVALLALLTGPMRVEALVRDFALACQATPDEVREQVVEFVRESLGRGLIVSG